MRRSPVVLLVLSSLVVAAPATAAERFASVSGDGAVCSAAAPCALPTAVQDAGPGDVVTVAPGTYPLTQTITVDGIVLRGADPADRPVLDFQAAGAGSGTDLYLGHDHVAARNLVLRNVRKDVGVYIDISGDLENVTASGTSARAVCSFLTNLDNTTATIQNVNCFQIGTGAAAEANSIANGALDIRNSTFAVQGGGTALAVENRDTTTPRIDLRNTVIAGPVTVDSGVQVHSAHNFYSQPRPVAIVADGGDVVHTQPFALFVRDDHGAGIPDSLGTVDAGTPAGAATNGIDVDGDVRTYGPAPDIGDDEKTVAPTAQTGAPAAVALTGAVVTGSVATGGARSTWFFEYGPTAAYGAQTPATAIPGQNTAVPAATELNGHPPGTTVHYRLVVTNRFGRSNGEDRSFTTTVPSPPPPPSGGTTPGTPSTPSTPQLPDESGQVHFATVITKLSLTTRAITFTTSRAGTVALLLERRTTGRKRNGRCSKSARRGRRCTTYTRVYRKTLPATAGTNTITLPKPKLRAGTYRLTATPTGGKAIKKTLVVG